MTHLATKRVAIIVAHPDDETLWAGGTILNEPLWKCYVVSLCRGSDSERAIRFHNALNVLQAEGIMGDLDDSPEQYPIPDDEVESMILELLPPTAFDLIITHNPTGEYTKHLRHEETSKAVIELWHNGMITTDELWTFAYEDNHKAYLPKAIENAAIYLPLAKQVWQRKYKLITETYGFEKESWEAKTTPQTESFWRFTHSEEAMRWLDNGGIIK